MTGPNVENNNILGDIFGLEVVASSTFCLPKTVWLPADKGKGLEVCGTFVRRGGQLYMDMTFSNKAMQVRLLR